MSATTVAALLAEATRALAGADARREAELLLTYVLRVDRAWLYAHAGESIDIDASTRFRSFVARRTSGEPLAYIVGRREFWSLDLQVTPDVLIPRAETELLVEIALGKIPQSAPVDIADLGTGSGAIALALARERPQARVLATDASVAALAVALGNAARLGLANIRFAQGDWSAALGDGRFDLIVSNPPYIAAGDIHLRLGDLRHEPAAALASGEDGLDAIRRIAAQAPLHLRDGAWLLVEHGYDQGDAVRDIFRSNRFIDVSTTRDLEGRERVSAARRVSPMP